MSHAVKKMSSLFDKAMVSTFSVVFSPHCTNSDDPLQVTNQMGKTCPHGYQKMKEKIANFCSAKPLKHSQIQTHRTTKQRACPVARSATKEKFSNIVTVTCQRWLPLRHCGRCCGGHEAPSPVESRL